MMLKHCQLQALLQVFFGNSLSEIDNEIKRYNKGEKDHLHELYQISDNGCYCFGYAMYFADTGAFSGTNNFAFFLPLDAVKKKKRSIDLLSQWLNLQKLFII